MPGTLVKHPPATNAFFEYEHVLQYEMPREDVLGDNNWSAWKMCILGFLELVDLEEYPLGQSPKPSQPHEYTVWKAKDRVVAHVIINNMDSSQVERVLGYRDTNGSELLTSAEIWQALRDHHESGADWELVLKLRKLRSVTDSDDFDIAERLAAVEELKMAMYNADCCMEDDKFNRIVTASLPVSWDNYTARLLAQREKISTGAFIAMLKSENKRRGEIGDVSRPKKRKRLGGDGLCSICHYNNHTTDNCRWQREGGYCTTCKRGGHWTRGYSKVK
jgi:hypothetical protein